MNVVQVIATTRDGTRAAIETAVLIAKASGASLSVLVPRIVSYPLAIGDADAADRAVHDYQEQIEALGGRGHVRVCTCGGIGELIEQLTVPGMTVVVGGPSGRWRMSPEERFANRLSRLGRHVLFTSTGPSTTSRRIAWPAAAVCCAFVLIGRSSYAQGVSPGLAYGGFLDMAILDANTDPGNHTFRNRSTTWRVDEPALNMAAVYLRRVATETSPLGFEATAQAGEDSQLFGFSTTAPPLAGAGVLRHLGPTSISYRAAGNRGVTIQGGIFNSVIGYDSLYAKDNFSYTRPWGADYTPFLMLGVNVACPLSERLTVMGVAVNGYWHLAHANDVPSVGGRLAYAAPDGLTLKQAVLYGPHQSDTSLEFWRVLSDSIAEWKLNRVTLAGELQVSTERVDADGRAWWVSVQAPAHWSMADRWGLTFRPEWCRDSAGRWTGYEQSVAAVTATIEYRWRIAQALARFRGEYRYDRSTGPGGGFFTGPAGGSGSPALTPGQGLAIAVVVLTFDGDAR